MRIQRAISVVAIAALGACGGGSGGSDVLSLVPDARLDAGGEVQQDTQASDTGAPPTDTGATDTGVPPTDTGVPPTDTGSPPADTGSPPADTGSPPAVLGGGLLLGEVDSSALNVAFAVARCTDVQPDDGSGTVYGPCVVRDVDPNAPEPVVFGYDAGAITVTGTSPNVTLTPSSEGALGTGYTSSLPDDQPNLLPGGGALVTINGAGGTIPAFTMVLQMPEPMTLSSPPTGFNVELSAGSDALVSWNAGTGDEVVVSLGRLGATGQAQAGPTALCTVSGDPGQMTVPKEAIAAVRGGSTRNAALGVTRTRSGTAMAGGQVVPGAATRSTGGLVKLVP